MDWQNGIGLNRNLDKISVEDKINVQYGGWKILVDKEKREGWDREQSFYIFWCPDCDNFSYDCPHGSIEERHLVCHRCAGRIDFVPSWALLKRALKLSWAWLRGSHAE